MSSDPRKVPGGLSPSVPRDQSILPVFASYIKALEVDQTQAVLVIGGGEEDVAILSAAGFQQVVLSNLKTGALSLDAEDIQLPDSSYSVVFAHTVLHHCRCPHKAVGEMLRVARDHVFFLDANDSWVFRLLMRLKFSYPYELGVTGSFDYREGGMRNGTIPNYMYRWTLPEVRKCLAAYHPERRVNVRARSYWAFDIYEDDLLSRKETRVGNLAKTLGPRNFIKLLHTAQAVLNVLPPVRAQGNRFFCAISKAGLQPWIEEREGQFFEKRGYRSSLSRPL